MYTKNTINSLINKGLNFSVATARALDPTLKMLDGMKLSIPIILLNGVLIYDTNSKEYIKVNRIEPQHVETIINTISKYNITGFMYELKNNGDFLTYHDTAKNVEIPKYILDRINKYKSIQPPNGLIDVSKENIVYFTLIDTPENLHPIYEFVSKISGLKQEFYKNVYNPDFWFLEIFSEHSSKKLAVEFLKKQYLFSQVVGFGDNNNDIPLFESCNIKVAVSNATQNLKEIADYICESNDDDGVTKWLEQHFVD